MRRLTDRVMLPYVDLIGAKAVPTTIPDDHGTASTDVPDGATSDYFHLANHELRTLELERIPKGARDVLSVGANGRWYFDWFEQNVGTVRRHVGVEAFEPKPDDLPDYVDWVVNTADHMDGVDDSSIDLVYAGQTTEHLWSHELSGFLAEANRVLRPNGLLVLDSPNRLVTEHLHWSHGGHTVELSAAEITTLLELAGFTVESVRGVWSCVDHGRRLGLEEGITDPAMFARRAAAGADAPDDCFVWWLVARRIAEVPDTQALITATDAVYDRHWPTRLNRGLFPTSTDVALPIATGASGRLGTTLPFPLHEGDWTITATLASGSWSDVDGFALRIVAPGDHLIHLLDVSDAHLDGNRASWTLHQPYLLFALSLEVHVGIVTRPVALTLPIDVRSAGHPSAS